MIKILLWPSDPFMSNAPRLIHGWVGSGPGFLTRRCVRLCTEGNAGQFESLLAGEYLSGYSVPELDK